MPLPNEVNQCDARCPDVVMLGYEYRRNAEDSGALERLAHGVIGSVKGVRAMGRSALVCPSRALGAEEWTPSDVCIQRAQRIAGTLRPILAESLTEQEAQVLPTAGIYPDA